MAIAWATLLAAAPGLASAEPARQEHAAAPAGPAGGLEKAMDARLDGDEARLRAIRLAARAMSTEDAAVQAQLAAIQPVQADLADAVATLTPRLQAARERLNELGPAPGPGQPREAPDVAEARARLLKFQTAMDDDTKRARLLSVEASQLSDALAERLRQNFSARLWARSRSVFDPTLWQAAAAALPGDLQRARDAAVGQGPPAIGAAERGSEVWAAVVAALGLLLLVPGRILLIRVGRRWAIARLPHSGLRKSALAVWLTLVGALAPPLAALLLYAALGGLLPLTSAMNTVARTFVGALAYASLIAALGRSLLAPGRSSWRMAPVSDAFAARVALFPVIIGGAAALASFLAHGGIALGFSPAATEASLGLGVMIQLLAVGTALAWARAAPAEAEEPDGHGERSASLPWVLATLAAWLALVAAVTAATTGYMSLASFIMREVIWIATVLATLFMSMRFVDDVCETLFAPRQGLSRLVSAATGLSDGALEQAGVLLSGVLRLGLIVFGWMAIVAPFGASVREILARATSTEMVFKLGQISVSPGLIFGGLVVFAVGLLITRVIRGWVETTYLPKTRIDVGLRTSITAGVTYLGALIALLATCAYLGLSLSNIALFASALSVGIGFGLQAVIGNFVSGLILLAERPVRVGDRIAIGNQEGDVRRINIRATEIEMGDRSKLIVPNSDLVSKTVRNVTHGGALGQVKIVLRVDDEADAGEVRDLLLDQLARHPGVLREPAPGVYLTNVADGALEFTAIAAVSSARQAFGIKSDLLFAMVAELKARGVKLAAATTVLAG
jgi:small-conductance mechanosensitive channel